MNIGKYRWYEEKIQHKYKETDVKLKIKRGSFIIINSYNKYSNTIGLSAVLIYDTNIIYDTNN